MANQLDTPGQLTLEAEQHGHEINHVAAVPQSMALAVHQYQQLAHPAAQTQLSHHDDVRQPQTDEHGIPQDYYMGEGMENQANVALVAGIPASESMALQVSVPAKYVCTCGCLQKRYLSHPEELEALEAQIEAIRAADKPAKKRKKNEKMAEGERKTRYGRAFEEFAQQWCRANMKILRGPLAEGEDAPSYCVKAAVNLLGVSLGYFYARSRRSHKGRLEEWSETMMKNHELEHLHPMKYGRIADRELMEVKGCCKGHQLRCMKGDTAFKTQSLVDVTCCSDSARNSNICRLKELLKDSPGLVQDWHDDYHVRHGENGKTRDVQRAILAEVLHEKICRKGIRMLLNCRVSNSRFKEVKLVMKEHGGSYRYFRK